MLMNQRGNNVANLAIEEGQKQQFLNYGVVTGSDPESCRISLETPEGESIVDVYPVYWSTLVDYPAPPNGSVVVWGFAGGLASQPFYLGVCRKPEYVESSDGVITMSGTSVKIATTAKTTINNKPVAVIGALDTGGDTLLTDAQ